MVIWSGVFIHGDSADYVVVERDDEPVTVLTVDAETFRAFAFAEEPHWDNWHGDEIDPEAAYEEQFRGTIIAERNEADLVTVIDGAQWADRRDFWDR